MYENFNAPSTESLDSIFNRLQKIVSQLAILGENISQEDLNVKFLRSLPTKWNTHVVVWINKPDIETMSFDDLYNNFKIVEQEVKRAVVSSSSSGSPKMAFLSSPSSINEVDNASIQVSAASTLVSTVSSPNNTDNLSDAIVYAFLANQPNGSQLVHEDLEQIHKDDLEEMNLKWQLALLSMRAKRPRNQDNSRKTVIMEDTSSKAMVAIDGAGFDWSYLGDDEVPTNMALMDFSNSEAYLHPFPSTIDLSCSSLEEFKQPEFESYRPKTSKSVCVDTSNVIKKVSDTPIIEDWVSDCDEDKNFASTAVLTKSGIVPISTARQSSSRIETPVSIARPINTVAPKPIVNVAKSRQYAFKKTHSLSRRPFHKQIALENRYLVNTAKVKSVNTIYTAKGKRNKSFLLNYQEYDGGFVAFAGSSKRGIENQLNHKVKIIRSDNETEFKNYEMNQFYGIKKIKREFSNARTSQQNRVTKRKNRTLIEAARTMVLVTKPHNKTPYELLIGRPPIISFMRPFGCPVTILNTLNHLGKFDGKADKGFLVGYSLNSEAFRVYNSITKKVEENLHVNFLENKSNVAGSGPEWLFDIDSLTNSMNYQPVSAGNRTNGILGLKIHFDVGQEGKKKVSDQKYILLPVLNTSSDVPSSSEEVESSHKDDAGKKSIIEPTCVEGGKIDDLGCLDQQMKSTDYSENTNSTNSINTASPIVNTASDKDGTFQRNFSEWNFSKPILVNAFGFFFSHLAALDDFPKMPNLEDTGIFDDAYDDRDEGAEADYNNLETVIPVSPIPSTRIHKDHPKEQIIGK
nr:hypothetical protein [Tanacetum cinerariifolium]